MMLFDPVLAPYPLQTSVAVVPFMDRNRNLMALNSSFVAQMHKQHETCGYASYLERYMQFPPPSKQPTLDNNDDCAYLWDEIVNEMLTTPNPDGVKGYSESSLRRSYIQDTEP